MLGGVLVACASNKQSTLSRSSTEAEYKVVAHICGTFGDSNALITVLGITVSFPINVYYDNLAGATFILNNAVCHAKMKHIGLYFHFIRERTENGLLKVEHI